MVSEESEALASSDAVDEVLAVLPQPTRQTAIMAKAKRVETNFFMVHNLLYPFVWNRFFQKRHCRF
jgi:hypothetical protein